LADGPINGVGVRRMPVTHLLATSLLADCVSRHAHAGRSVDRQMIEIVFLGHGAPLQRMVLVDLPPSYARNGMKSAADHGASAQKGNMLKRCMIMIVTLLRNSSARGSSVT
jgi:hypothetical protein